jgi:YYY domain-containing protein
VIDALLLWLLALVIGAIGLPFVAFFLARLPGRGLTLARPLGLLLVGYPLWLLASTGLLDYARWAAVAGVAVVAGAGVLLWRRSPPFQPRDPVALRLWLVGELLFTTSFFGWLLLHSFSPDVWQTEKPMDMAIVNAINRSESFPPHDPWLAGSGLNYYYFGHYLVALLIRVVGAAPEVGFNVAVALFFALCVTAVFGVASSLALAARERDPVCGRSRTLLLPGLAAAGLAMLVGNLAGAFRLFEHPTRPSLYDWWAPSRVIAGTANEFPFFSFLLGDLHAHVMAVPFALLGLAFALQLALNGPRSPRKPSAAVPELALGALVLGSLYAINSLDFPTAATVGILALALWVLQAQGRSWAALWAAVWLAASVLLFLPFWLHFSPTTHGVGLVSRHDHFSRFLGDIGLIYGLPLWVIATVFAHRLALPFRYLAWGGVAGMVTLVLLSPPRLAGLALALALAAFALFVALSAGPADQAYRFLWLLIGVGIGLIGLGELVYVRDAFDGTPSYRFNTVFKAGYQAWFLLAIAAGCALALNREWLGSRSRGIWRVGFVALLGLAVVYPVLGSYSRSASFSRSPTLDGLRWLELRAPRDVAAIEWLRTRVPGAPTVLEEVGRDFDPEGRGRVSTYTGLPTVLGWAGHEIQWGHHGLRRRGEDVRRLYATRDMPLAENLLRRYRVKFVFVGSLERKDYAAASLAKFSRLGRVVFRSGRTAIYEIANEPT